MGDNDSPTVNLSTKLNLSDIVPGIQHLLSGGGVSDPTGQNWQPQPTEQQTTQPTEQQSWNEFIDGKIGQDEQQTTQPDLVSQYQKLGSAPLPSQFHPSLWRRVLGNVEMARRGHEPEGQNILYGGTGGYTQALQSYAARKQALEEQLKQEQTATESQSAIQLQHAQAGELGGRETYYRSQANAPKEHLISTPGGLYDEDTKQVVPGTVKPLKDLTEQEQAIEDARITHNLPSTPEGRDAARNIVATRTFNLERQARIDDRNAQIAASNTDKREAREATQLNAETNKVDDFVQNKYALPLEQQQSRLARFMIGINAQSPAIDPVLGAEFLTTEAGGPSSNIRMSDAELKRINAGVNFLEDIQRKTNYFHSNTPYQVTPQMRSAYRQITYALNRRLSEKQNAIKEASDKINDVTTVKEARQVRHDLEKRLVDIDNEDIKMPIDPKSIGDPR